MKIHETFIESFDGFRLSAKYFEADSPKAAIQIVHGMSEHKERYDEFARFLTERGYTVITSDLRSHGQSSWPDGTLGYFGSDGIKTLVQDQKAVNQNIRGRYTGLPVYMFAHSMGSLIARNYLCQNDASIQKLILSGAPCYQNGCGFAVTLCKILRAFSGDKGHNAIIRSFAPKGKNKANPNEWLSYNAENVKAYDNDKMCGFYFTNSGYLTLYELDRNLHRYEDYELHNSKLPIRFFAGKDDIVTGGAKGLQDSADSLKRAGYQDVGIRMFEHMRHEILNEDNRSTVMADAADFFDI